MSSVTLFVLLLCGFVSLTLSMDALWFGSLPDVVETTPAERKSSRVGIKHRTRIASNVTSTRRVTAIKRRINVNNRTVSSSSSSSATVTTEKIPRLKTNHSRPMETKMEEVTYWETGSGGNENPVNESSSNGGDGEVSVKEHDRSPHPAAFSGGGGDGWFGRFKNHGASSVERPPEAVSVAGYQNSGEAAEATVHIKEHDESGVGAGVHFTSGGGGADEESALWFGGDDFSSDNRHSIKTETPSSSSSDGGGGGGGGGWFGLDDWAPLISPTSNHRQQRRLSYRQTPIDPSSDIITAQPETSKDTFSFVVNSNLGGGGGGNDKIDKTTFLPPLEMEEDVIITAEPSAAEDNWFEDVEEETTTTTPSTSTTTTTTTNKPEVINKNNSYILSISKTSSVNEQPSIIDFIEEEEENDQQLSTTLSSNDVSTSTSASFVASEEETTEQPTTTSFFELFFITQDNATTTTTTTTTERQLPVISTTVKPLKMEVTEKVLSVPNSREGREFANDGTFVMANSNNLNLTKSAVMTSSSNVPKVIKNVPLTSSSSAAGGESRDNTAYIIVGSCCAVSLLCLVVVVAILRYRKSVRRRHQANSFYHYPIDRDPRYCHYDNGGGGGSGSWNESNQGVSQGHKGYQHQFNSCPPQTSSSVVNPKARNLWFIGRKRTAPYTLCEQSQQPPPPQYVVQADGTPLPVASSSANNSAHHFAG